MDELTDRIKDILDACYLHDKLSDTENDYEPEIIQFDSRTKSVLFKTGRINVLGRNHLEIKIKTVNEKEEVESLLTGFQKKSGQLWYTCRKTVMMITFDKVAEVNLFTIQIVNNDQDNLLNILRSIIIACLPK